MVDFRYHLVSIIAVFLALALGIVVGTTALNGALLDNLKGSVGTLTADKRTLEGTIGSLRAQTGSDDQLVDRIGAAAVAGQLQGRRVVLVGAPGASSDVLDALTPLLEAAGAAVAGTVQLRPDLLDPARAAVVEQVASQVAPEGLALPATDGALRAAAELAAALVRSPSGPEISTASAGAVLAGFAGKDLVDLGADLGARSDLAVLVTGDPVGAADVAVQQERSRTLLALAAALDATGSGTVVAGPLTATAAGGVLRALRDDGSLSERVSSVDGVDRPAGRVAVVYALREQEDGSAGRYGTGPGTQGPVPQLPPR